jgi:hypothetical protein
VLAGARHARPDGADRYAAGGRRGVVGAHEVRGNAPDLGLAGANGVEESNAVTVARGKEQPRKLVHGDRRYWWESVNPERRLPRMTCMQIHQAASARLDGEAPGLDESTVSPHRAGCADRREFSYGAEGLRRSVRPAPAPEIPDLTPGSLTAIGAESFEADSLTDGEPDTNVALRWIHVAIALAQLA